MKLKPITSAFLALGLVAGCASQSNLRSQAKVSEADARATALAKVPGGTIKEGELERENGHLQWSFDVSVPGEKEITEVNVDAVSGDVINVGKEAPEQ